MKDLICLKSSKAAGLEKSDINYLTKVAKAATHEASKVLMKNYGKISTIENKGRIGDLVTNADTEAEEIVIDYLRKSTPDISILAEESGSLGPNKQLTWCVDPLDGTTNYTHGYPFFGTSIGLTWSNMPVLGSISVPFLNEHYWAAPGLGAFCNERPIKVSSSNKLQDSLLVTGFAYDRTINIDNNYAEFCWLTHRTRGVRRGGAAAVDLAFVACGRLDGYWERGLSPWDLAAGICLVELAGGIVSDYGGNAFDLLSGRVLACTEGIREDLIDVLAKVKPLDKHCFGVN